MINEWLEIVRNTNDNLFLSAIQGICEGLTYEEIQERFPQEFAWRDQDKFKYRYPHGESYLDLLQRVDSVVQALLTKTEVLVVSHQAVLRCIMAYFMGSQPGKRTPDDQQCFK